MATAAATDIPTGDNRQTGSDSVPALAAAAVDARTGAPAAAAGSAPHRPRLHLDYLDGIRGVAALYVAFYHASMGNLFSLETAFAAATPAMVSKVAKAAHFSLLNHGHYAVVAFIVLSGFVLMLPLARSHEEKPRLNVREFVRRRTRRIVPPYYAAIALSLALIALAPAAQWGDSVPAFTWEAIGSHILLVHNFHREWVLKINPPMWSVALEYQIYFIFALVLFPLWRRFGLRVSLAAAFAIGLLPHFLTPATSRWEWSNAWMVIAFASGMAGAVVCFHADERTRRMREAVPWLGVFAACAAALLLIVFAQRERFLNVPLFKPFQVATYGGTYPFDIIASLGTTALIIGLALHLIRQQEAATSAATSDDSERGAVAESLLRLFQAKPIVTLGKFSYSLYLIHVPILVIVDKMNRTLLTSGLLATLSTYFIGIPVTVACAYLFYLAIERHFVNTGLSRPAKAAAAAAA